MEMRITKHEQSFLSVECDGERLIIDPGTFTGTVETAGVVAVVITHGHDDHCSLEHLASVRAALPETPIFAPADVAARAPELGITVVAPGDRQEAAGFTLEFVGGTHAEILPGIETPENVGVIVNGTLYQPGDAYFAPGHEIPLLALPISGPWSTLKGSVGMLDAVRPSAAFNIHDAPLSQIGLDMWNRHIGREAVARGVEYSPLAVGDSLLFNG